MSSDRTKEILEYLHTHDRATVRELCEMFHVSDMTIRRSLQALEARQLITRFHGGAMLNAPKTQDDEFHLRMSLNPQLKVRLAHGCSQYLQKQITENQCSSVFIASGSTMLNFAKSLNLPPQVTAITDNLYVSQALLANGVGNIITIGGQILLPSANAVGFLAEQMISAFTPDLAFVSAPAVDHNGAVYVYNLLEANVYQAVIRVARHIVLSVDHTKFHQRNLVQLYTLDERFTLFTTKGAPENVLEQLRNRGVDVHVV